MPLREINAENAQNVSKNTRFINHNNFTFSIKEILKKEKITKIVAPRATYKQRPPVTLPYSF
jgi:hypothetical protein